MKTKSGLRVQSITIIGRRWFHRTYGNTYHTAEIFVNGQRVHKTAEEYGYGDQYEETAMRWLEKFGYAKRREYSNGGQECTRIWAERVGVQLSRSVSDVSRERDL